MKSLKWLNENNNVSVKMRDSVRTQILAKLGKALNGEFDSVVKNANGGFSVAIAVDEKSGETIYANFDFTVNMKDPSEKIERKKGTKKVAKADEPIPSIFDEE